MSVSGDGFIVVADGTRRWGRYGAAGILARHTAEDGSVWYFVARRSEWTHRGGTWAIPGGALHRDEEPLAGALREFAEEVGHLLEDHELIEVYEDDHGGWRYWTLVVDVPERFDLPDEVNWETADVRWVQAAELAELELFDSFEETLTRLGVLPPRSPLGDDPPPSA